MSRVKGSSSVGWKGAGGSEGCTKDCARSLYALKPAWWLVTRSDLSFLQLPGSSKKKVRFSSFKWQVIDRT